MNLTPHVSVDVGGTFTDIALLTETGLTTAKVPSTVDQSEGVIEGIRKACRRANIAIDDIEMFTHAMTVSVNALLEGDGAETTLVTTEGFRDVLEIGRQTRDSLYDLSIKRTEPLVPRSRRVTLNERTTTEGVETEVALEDIDMLAEEIRGAESVAVSLLHAYSDPKNEAVIADRLREQLDVPISVSHEVLPAFREYERTSTTVVDAYVRPAIDSYLERLIDRARDVGLPEPRVMQSNGGIVDADIVRKRAVTTVLSGPAAGVVGAKASASHAVADEGVNGLVTFDMGGTSSDVSLVRDGDIARTTDASIGGHPIATPMVDIETVGSGGGSVAWVDEGGALRVGPKSAGADPGPACYGNGGQEATVTDANVVLGYIGADASLGGEFSLDADAAREALDRLAEEAGLDSAREAAAGVYRVANATMTRAIRSVTVERGYDPREFALVAFGGAGPMHAAALADRLEMDRVIIPLAGGVLSAYGLSAADEKHDTMQTYRTLLADADADKLESVYRDLTDNVRTEIDSGGEILIERTAELRYKGQSFELGVSVDEPVDLEEIRERFHAIHKRAYGYRMDDPIEIVTLQVSARIENEPPTVGYEAAGTSKRSSRVGYFDGEQYDIDVFERNAIQPRTEIKGPVVLEDDESTTVIPPSWSGTVLEDGTLILTRGDTQ